MNNRTRKRIAFRPSLVDPTLEDRLVLSSITAAPLAAPPPVPSAVVISSPAPFRTVGQLRTTMAHEVQIATLDLRNGVAHEIQQLFANGSVPTAQQMNDFNATVQGVLNATALGLSSQASLLPGAGTSLVPAIQNAVLGSGSRSLSSELSSLLQSDRNAGSAVRLQSVFARAIMQSPTLINRQFNSFFNTTNLTNLSVNSSGQRIPIRQFMCGQVVSQLGNTLGLLAQSFPNVANSMLFPNGTTGIPTQDMLNSFNQQAVNALSTASFQLGSVLSLFPGSSSVISQLQPVLFGSTSNTSSFASALQNLSFGTSGFNSAVTNEFNTGFNNLLGPLRSFLGMQGQSNLTLPTSGLTGPFGSQFSGNSFNSGFNNGFATGTNSGFIGFGTAPAAFNTNFGSGFNNMVTTVTQNQGIGTVHFPGIQTSTTGVPFELF